MPEKEPGFKFESRKEQPPEDLEKIRKGLGATLRALEVIGESEKEGELMKLIKRKGFFGEKELSDEEFKNKLFQRLRKEFWEEEEKYAKIPPPRNAAEQSRWWNLTPAPLKGRILDGFESIATDGVGREITVVNRKEDKKLAELCDWAKGMRKIKDEEERAFRIAQLVSKRMGGSDPIVKDGIRSTMVGERKLLLGEIKRGVCRHRAPLFQVLATEAGLDSRMEGITGVRGYAGEPHVGNWIFLEESGEIIIVDAMYPPKSSKKGPKKKFEEMSYDEFKARGRFPRWGSNRLSFEIYQRPVLTFSKFEPVGESLVRFGGGWLGADGLEELLKVK